MHLVLRIVALAVLTLAGSGARAERAAPSRENLAEGRRLYQAARNLRTLRVPLLERRVRTSVGQTLDELQRLGVKVVREAPLLVDSTRELQTLLRAAELLRGARSGSQAYKLRREVVTRAHELHHSTYGFPRQLNAYSSYQKGYPELIVNLDNPFYGKAHKLFTVVAHEERHLVDIKRLLSLVRRLADPALATAAPGTREAGLRARLQDQLVSLESPPRAEARAFEAQARALGLAGKPLGTFWRAPQGNQLDQVYPPDRLNRALIQGYLAGVGKAAGTAMRAATPEQRSVAASYLRGYRSILEAQAQAYVKAVRADAGRDPGAIARYHEEADRTLARAQQLLAGDRFGAEEALALGQADAISSAPPRVLELLAR